jgi:hypothetical protein
MFVAIDQEVGAAFGPFTSNEEGVLWVRDRLLDTSVIALDDEIAALAQGRNSIEAIQEDLMSMKWFIYEVEYVEDWPPEKAEPDDQPTPAMIETLEAQGFEFPTKHASTATQWNRAIEIGQELMEMCAADCGCAGGQPFARCTFEPFCSKCRDDEEPKDDNPWDSGYAGGPYSSHPNR